MAYFTGAGGALPPRFASGVRLRVDNGGTYLGDIYSLLKARVPGYTPPPTTTTTTIPVKSSLTPLISPTPVSPAPLPSSFSPAPAPTPAPAYSPPPPPPPPASIPYDEPPPPPPVTYPSSGGGGRSNGTGAGAVAAAAAPIVGAIDPAAGAAAALFPAFANAAGADPTTQIRFTNDPLPDMSLPEVYNADGTPVTATAKAATVADKIKALPPAAKIGGAVALYLLLHGGL
jgi:hypothetical protein